MSDGYCDVCGGYGRVHNRIEGEPCPVGDEVEIEHPEDGSYFTQSAFVTQPTAHEPRDSQ